MLFGYREKRGKGNIRNKVEQENLHLISSVDDMNL